MFIIYLRSKLVYLKVLMKNQKYIRSSRFDNGVDEAITVNGIRNRHTITECFGLN